MSIRSQITSSQSLMKGDTVMTEDRRGQVDTENDQITAVDLRIERSISKISSGQRQHAVYHFHYKQESHTRQEHKTVETDMLEDELDEFEAFWDRKWDPQLIMDPANPDDRDPAKIEVLSYMPENTNVMRVSRLSKSSATRTSVAFNPNFDKKKSSGKRSHHHKKSLESTSTGHHHKNSSSDDSATRTSVAVNQNVDKEDKKKSSGKKSHHKKYPRSTSTGHHHKRSVDD